MSILRPIAHTPKNRAIIGRGSMLRSANIGHRYTLGMDHLWTPWRYRYVTGAEDAERADRRLGVPPALASYYTDDQKCVFCNLLGSVDAAIAKGMSAVEAEKAALVLHRYKYCYICLNAYPYSTGHIMIVPYVHLDSLAQMASAAAQEMMQLAQRVDGALRAMYQPDGLNFGLNLGQAAGAGVAEHLHLHALPRWLGDTNFMTTTAETRVLPEPLDVTWQKLRNALEN
jgi:ATP adenylyltransferase